MQLALRSVFPFCRAQAYLQRFRDLEEEVSRREREVIQKREQLDRLRELSHLTTQDRFLKYFSLLTDKPFESEAVRHEREKLASLKDLLMEVRRDGISRSDVAKRLAEEEKLNKEKTFLIDMARFANKFHRLAHHGKFSPEVKLGLELSSKNLEHQLQKEGIEFMGSRGEKVSKEVHEQVDGEGEQVAEVLERGIKARGVLVSKAKVQAKHSD